MEPLIIYHGSCYDGFTAAWVTAEALNEQQGAVPEWFAARYGDAPPDCSGRDVYIVDFSYPREVMERLHADARSLLVLDHHKTAREALEGLDYCIFDMVRSGCRMAWDHFMYGTEPPKWVLRIEDRDLWRFRYDDTKDCHAYVASLPMTMQEWDRLASTPFEDIVAGGKAIRRYIDTYCEKAATESYVKTWGAAKLYRVAVCNVPYQNASELADVLLRKHEDCDFSCGWFKRSDGRVQFSLRSRGDCDVSEIAKAHGGGGHAGAAGFDLSTEEAEGLV